MMYTNSTFIKDNGDTLGSKSRRFALEKNKKVTSKREAINHWSLLLKMTSRSTPGIETDAKAKSVEEVISSMAFLD